MTTRVSSSRPGAVQRPRQEEPTTTTTPATTATAATPARADGVDRNRRTLPGTTRDGPGATAAMPALPISRREMGEWTTAVGAQATTTGNGRIQFGDNTITIPPGTQLSTVASDTGLTIRANPPLSMRHDLVGPLGVTVDVASLTYDFRQGRFSADVRGHIPGRVDDRIFSAIGSDQATQALRPLLPPNMQQRGYSPRLDPDLQGTVRRALDGFARAGGTGPAPQTPALRDVTGWVELRPLRDVNVDFQLPGRRASDPPQDARFSIPRGTSVTISATAQGTLRTDALPSASELRLDSASIHFAGGANLQVGDSRLTRARIDSVTLERGGTLRPQYDLQVEQDGRGVMAGLQGLLAVAGMRSGSGELVNAAANIRPHEFKLDGVHQMIDSAVNQGARPALLELFRQNDRAIPGLSLMDLMGVR